MIESHLLRTKRFQAVDVSSRALVSVFNAVTSVTAGGTMTAGVQQVVPFLLNPSGLIGI